MGRFKDIKVEYSAWVNMKHRCLNPKHKQFKDYGGRGITVCPQWLNSFSTFLQDVGRKPSPELTLDRINNSGNYEPSNVAWRSRKDQASNRRPYVRTKGLSRKKRSLLTLAGETRPISEWEQIKGISGKTIRRRLQQGWSVDLALNTPLTR